jgi:hypothetical protein
LYELIIWRDVTVDIFKYAKEFNADYYEQATGYIYKVQAYNRALKLELPTEGIEVYDTFGNFIGIVRKENKNNEEDQKINNKYYY